MLTNKQRVLQVVNSLRDDCTMEDIYIGLYLRRKVEEGIRAADLGDVLTTAEAMAEIPKWRRSWDSGNQ